MKNNLLTRIGGRIGQALVLGGALAGAGKAYANPSVSDLRALEDYAKAHGQRYSMTLNGVDQGPLYVSKSGDYTLQVNQNFIMITKDGDNSYILYDFGRDGNLDSLAMTKGRLTEAEKAILELRLMFRPNHKDSKLEMDLAGIQKNIKNGPNEKRKEFYFDKEGVTAYDFDSEQSFILPENDATAKEMKKFGEGAYEAFTNKTMEVFGLKQ